MICSKWAFVVGVIAQDITGGSSDDNYILIYKDISLYIIFKTYRGVCQVMYIEDATAKVNADRTYEFPGLDILRFVGSVLHGSNVIEVLDYEKYVEEYAGGELKT